VTSNFLGRIETRLFVVFTVGLLWTLIITPFLPLPAGSDRFTITLRTLGLVAALGVVVWEPVYHLLQQFRWEKDWPAMFLALQVVNEGILVRLVLDWTVAGSVGLGTFVLHFATTWLFIYLFLQGPMRVPFLRWRFRGGRIL
jgi:hypothetical protein